MSSPKELLDEAESTFHMAEKSYARHKRKSRINYSKPAKNGLESISKTCEAVLALYQEENSQDLETVLEQLSEHDLSPRIASEVDKISKWYQRTGKDIAEKSSKMERKTADKCVKRAKKLHDVVSREMD